MHGLGLRIGGDGERWAASLGFARSHGWVRQQLVVADADPALWDVPLPAGYRLEQWSDVTPESLVASYARAKGAIHDAPSGDSSFRFPEWTVERVRQAEAECRERGVEQRVVAAVHEADGEVAGLTELEVHPANPGEAEQQQTAVLAEHRGHGLGLCLKSAMMLRLLSDRPAIVQVGTTTAADNVHMQRVNGQLGYVTVRAMTEVEAEVAALRRRLE
ncbi:hypothetical protein GXW82_12245 [Streptacidiphilus sp. 4-A2]|nr:hypothetical protein [Streptacidiphilus sp. 4-A2]